jgi:hypothetical protein
MDHQLEELTKAIEQTINIEAKKARIDVMNIVSAGVDSGENPSTILANILDWCGK